MQTCVIYLDCSEELLKTKENNQIQVFFFSVFMHVALAGMEVASLLKSFLQRPDFHSR